MLVIRASDRAASYPGTAPTGLSATLATWGMTLVIQRAEHRDTQSIHAKLDELLKVHGDAKNSLMTVDNKDAEEVERQRAQVRAS
ncbi:low affinity iron permease family protein [Bradyrhizobium sp. 182]|uniref:low affinity iron permease family protein n=1 Tax=unclassified Bradyrhizobium TaxID=2631580 RepID=UPI0021113A9F|nr:MULTISPECIES: low affinity iron permease family protein [unclassified Bradyrhizobium]MCK1420766.1 low affinity iron permease family protein [Bradyrhizobium sp. CW12]MCK1528503.1 low affinity iron permease family protein [Bradyrhizobium sp. 182]MCK1599263.1 low affinity iron permease family protein [Bradyrhizobium sp. 164]MCK1620757.1 low affinity iron permease family protein [Bradyrhizobium sp. 159]MCK1643372.1 low affinity iron permease family protein [Bradyrhizobium sp. 154]